MSKIVAVIEARMASSRLPEKIMLPLAKTTVMDLIVERLRKSENIDEICIATTINDEDQILVDHFSEKNVRVFRGSELNVLDRVLKAAIECKAQVLVEITGDCPFVDPQLVDYMIELLRNNDLEYIANNFETSFADGFDVQVYYFDALERMANMALTDLEKEHVTMKIRQNPNLFRTLNLVAPSQLKRPNYSVTLDTPEDYEVIQLVYQEMQKSFGPNFGVFEITKFLDSHPEIASINSKVHRKGYT